MSKLDEWSAWYVIDIHITYVGVGRGKDGRRRKKEEDRRK